MKEKRADCLELGDVIARGRERWVVIETSDTVASIPLDQEVDGVLARHCCEPRLQLLGRTGRRTHICTYVLWPNRKRVSVRGHMDLEVRSSTPEWDDPQRELARG